MAGLYFEELAAGRKFDHAVHLDREAARETEFGEPLVNGVLTLGLMVGISVYDTTYGTTIANLGGEKVQFPRPVRVGDTLRIVTFEHRAFNRRNEEVASCLRAALMRRRPAA